MGREKPLGKGGEMIKPPSLLLIEWLLGSVRHPDRATHLLILERLHLRVRRIFVGQVQVVRYDEEVVVSEETDADQNRDRDQVYDRFGSGAVAAATSQVLDGPRVGPAGAACGDEVG